MSEEDRELLRQVEGRPAIVVENKSDLLDANAQAGTRGQQCPRRTSIATSAQTGEGIADLRAAILRHVAGDAAMQQESGFLTNVRHQKLVTDALTALVAATSAVLSRVPHEMLLLDLYASLRPLDEITGATSTEDILNLIFGTFCIGK
jgi:tRNA modification GTPase